METLSTLGNEDLLLHLVQAILPDKGIVSVSLEPQEQIPLRPEARRSVVDVRCGTDEARKSTRTPLVNPCRNAFYCVSLRVRLLNIVQNWGIIGARFNKETL